MSAGNDISEITKFENISFGNNYHEKPISYTNFTSIVKKFFEFEHLIGSGYKISWKLKFHQN